MNVITWLEFELGYYDSAVQHFNYYTTRTPLPFYISFKWCFYWNLRDSKCLQVFGTLPDIHVDFINLVIWMISVYPLISTSSNLLWNRSYMPIYDWNSKIHKLTNSSLFGNILVIVGLEFLPGWNHPFVSQSSREYLIKFVRIWFVSRVKFESLAQFPVDHLSHPLMSRHSFLSCQLSELAYLS